MNKQKYLAELAGLLSFLNEEDRRTVMHYYSGRFEKAGESGEAALILELGPPMRLAIALNRGGIESILDAEENEAADVQEPEAEIVPEISAEPMGDEPQPEAEGAEEAPANSPEPEELPVAETEVGADESQDETAPEKTETEEETDAVELVQKTIAEIIEQTEQTEQTEEKPVEERAPDINTAELIREVMREDEADGGITHNEAFPELSVVTGKAPRTPEPEREKTRISVWGAILYVLLLLIPGVPLLVLSALLVPALLVPIGAFGVVALNGIGAGIATLIYLPDAMFVFGAAMVVIGLGLLYLVFAVWVIYLIIRAWGLGLPALYRRLVRREGAK